MLEFPPRASWRCNELCRVDITQKIECFFEFGLPYETQSGKVFGRRFSRCEICALEEALGASVVAGGEVDLSKPESIGIAIWSMSISTMVEE